jgi:hypothetical protein
MFGAMTVRVFAASSFARFSISGVKPVELITIAAPFSRDFEMLQRCGGAGEIERHRLGRAIDA